MFVAAIDFIQLLPFAIFFAFAAGAWFVADQLMGKKTRTDVRLEQLRAGRTGELKSTVKASDGITRLLQKASPALSKPFQPKTEKDTNKLRDRLVHAGFRGEAALTLYLTVKTLSLIIGFLFGGGVVLISNGFTLASLMRVAFVGLGAFFLPDLVLAFMGKKRKEKIFLGLPDALDLMTVCVEAGLGLDQAMRKVAEEMVHTNATIAYEFGMSNMQLQMGRQREDVLVEMGDRNGVDDLKALSSIIIQADRFGSSIGQALRVQSDSMRTRRRQLAEEKAAKTAVKLIFPLVLFIFPGIFVVLVGPAAITMINEMLPAFQR
jgi:tight adherence protein C